MGPLGGDQLYAPQSVERVSAPHLIRIRELVVIRNGFERMDNDGHEQIEQHPVAHTDNRNEVERGPWTDCRHAERQVRRNHDQSGHIMC